MKPTLSEAWKRVTTAIDAGAGTTDAEWDLIAEAIEAGWGKPFLDEDVVGWRIILDGEYPAGALIMAVRNLARAASRGKGNGFPPSAADVALEANLLVYPELAPVAWDEVWTAIAAARRHRDFPRHGFAKAKALFVGNQVGAELGAIAGAFAASNAERIANEPIGDPDRAGAILARYADDWQDYAAKIADRRLRGIPVRTPAEVLETGDRVSITPAAPVALLEEGNR